VGLLHQQQKTKAHPPPTFYRSIPFWGINTHTHTHTRVNSKDRGWQRRRTLAPPPEASERRSYYCQRAVFAVSPPPGALASGSEYAGRLLATLAPEVSRSASPFICRPSPCKRSPLRRRCGCGRQLLASKLHSHSRRAFFFAGGPRQGKLASTQATILNPPEASKKKSANIRCPR